LIPGAVFVSRRGSVQDGGRSPRRSSRALGDAVRFSGYGISWVLTILLLVWGGRELDEWLGTTPLLVLLGAFLGVGAGFCTLYVRAVVEPAAKGKEIPGSGEEHR
jgi:F0F1-type ATP synthase assembly protein I